MTPELLSPAEHDHRLSPAESAAAANSLLTELYGRLLNTPEFTKVVSRRFLNLDKAGGNSSQNQIAFARGSYIYIVSNELSEPSNISIRRLQKKERMSRCTFTTIALAFCEGGCDGSGITVADYGSLSYFDGSSRRLTNNTHETQLHIRRFLQDFPPPIKINTG